MGTVVRVKGIRRWQHPKTGIWYCYHRKSRTPIHAEFGSSAFFAELATIEKSQQAKTARPGTLGLAIDAYHRTPAWAALRPETQVSYERAIAILEPLRDMPLIALNRATIIRLRDEKIFPRHGRWMANYVVTFLGILLPFCRDYDFIKDNPLAERVKKSASRGTVWSRIDPGRRKNAESFWRKRLRIFASRSLLPCVRGSARPMCWR